MTTTTATTCVFSFIGRGEQQQQSPPSSLTCQINIEPSTNNLTLIGQQDNVLTTRNEILNLYPSHIHLNLKIPNNKYNVQVLQNECSQIATETNTTISITEPIPQSSFNSQNTVNILITGIPDQAELARVKTLVILDRQKNLCVDTCHIPYKLHHMICGRKRTGLSSILQETATSIYFPSPFIYRQEQDDTYSPTIYITGETNETVAHVKDMLTQLASEKAQIMVQKDAVLHPRKLDWLLIHRKNDIRKIMRDNGSFISFPKPSSGGNLVSVFSDSRVNAERTLRCLHFLACDIYEACFYFNHLRDGGAIYGAADTFFHNINNVAALVSQLSQISGAEVAYKSADPVGCIEVFGTERAIRHVYQRLHEMTFLKMFHQSTVFNVELSNDQREFISGKKSGKINKIMKTSGAKIKFVPFSEYNFIIEVESNNFNKALDGLTLLQEELPAEISFYVPEVYHKRIIGVGGKNIQRIMKKYGVYVKFSNAEEFAALGGYYDNEDNVVARTPMKNQINLENLRHAVMDLINPKDRDCVEQVLYDVPFYLHRELIKHQAKYFADMTKKTNTTIIWPDDECATDNLILVGPESQVGLAVQMVRSIVPEEYNVYLPFSTQATLVLESESFDKDIVQRLKNEYSITVELKKKLVAPSDEKEETNKAEQEKEEEENKEETQQQDDDEQDKDEEDKIITLKMTKGNFDCLNVCLEILISYLSNHQVNLYDDSAIVRHAPSSTLMMNNDPTPLTHFDSFNASKIISSHSVQQPPPMMLSPTPSSSSSLMADFHSPLSPTAAIHSPPPAPLGCYSLFDYPSSTSGNALDASWRNFRDIHRNVDNTIRAIFDSAGSTTTDPSSTNGGFAAVPPPPISLVSPLSFRGGPAIIPPTSPNGVPGLDIWSNHPLPHQHHHQSLNGFVAASNSNTGLDSKYGFYNPTSSTTYTPMVVPTSSTSTGSNNSSMHSSQSMPDISTTATTTNTSSITPTPSTSNKKFNGYHTQQPPPPPPLIYPSASSSTTRSFAAAVEAASSSTGDGSNEEGTTTGAAALSSSVSTPTTTTKNQHTTTSNSSSSSSSSSSSKLNFPPALFSLNHSSADETVIVQSLLNNMSIKGGPLSNLNH